MKITFVITVTFLMALPVHFFGFLGFILLAIILYCIPPMHLEVIAERRSLRVDRPLFETAVLYLAPVFFVLFYLVLKSSLLGDLALNFSQWSSEAKFFTLLQEQSLIGILGSSEFRNAPSQELDVVLKSMSAIYMATELYFVFIIGLIIYSKTYGTEDLLRISTSQWYHKHWPDTVRKSRFVVIAFITSLFLVGTIYLLHFGEGPADRNLQLNNSSEYVTDVGKATLGTVFMLIALREFLYWDYIEEYLNDE